MTEIEALHTHIQSLQNELKEMTEDKNHFADKSISLAKLLTEKEITISKIKFFMFLNRVMNYIII